MKCLRKIAGYRGLDQIIKHKILNIESLIENHQKEYYSGSSKVRSVKIKY